MISFMLVNGSFPRIIPILGMAKRGHLWPVFGLKFSEGRLMYF